VFGVRDGRLPMGVLVIETDEGIDGNDFLSLPGPGPEAVAKQIVTFLAPLLIGEDPLERGRLWRLMAAVSRFVDPIAIGSVDVALWDIAGKVAGLPIHRLLGSCRDRVPVYFSSGHHERPEDYAEEALHWREQGWSAYKVHPPRAWRKGPPLPIEFDIRACELVREAVGPEMALMLDSTWGYSYVQALRVGRAIEELEYHWYEDPLPPEDIHGYSRLRDHLTIPLLATELTLGGLYALPPWITARATDFLRGDVAIKGGITGMMKIAHLAEAFHMNCEVHDGYNALNNLANLHVIMAIDNCEFFEVLAFNPAGRYGLEHLSYGLTTPAQIDGDGAIHAPTGPGLGVAIDWELIESGKVGEVR
jgi:L-alanine-DL-glutamate epimerase-like enolase superfamily enzyme